MILAICILKSKSHNRSVDLALKYSYSACMSDKSFKRTLVVHFLVLCFCNCTLSMNSTFPANLQPRVQQRPITCCIFQTVEVNFFTLELNMFSSNSRVLMSCILTNYIHNKPLLSFFPEPFFHSFDASDFMREIGNLFCRIFKLFFVCF